MEPLVKNAADEEQLKGAAKKEKISRKRALDDLKWVLSERRGRRFFRELIEECGVFRQSYTGNNDTVFNEGKRRIGLKLWGDLSEASPEIYALMMQEKLEDV